MTERVLALYTAEWKLAALAPAVRFLNISDCAY
jgi:hypothetical protein